MHNMGDIRRSNHGHFSWLYRDFCQERNLKPLNALQAYLPLECLRFRTDRVSLEHWSPILRSIAENRSLSKIHMYSRNRCKKVLEEVDTEEKLYKLWRCRGEGPMWPILYTNFLLHCFVDSVAVYLRETSTLTTLIIDGIPLRPKYLIVLCAGLKSNVTVTKLSLCRCRIGDNGCDLLLACLRNNPKLGILNLTACRLTSRSGRSLSLFLKRRNADVLQNVWEEYSQSICEENYGSRPPGLHTLILNQNPKLGDMGVQQLSHALKADVCLKLLSLRRCGISKYTAETLMQILHVNNVLKVLDITENQIPINTLQKLFKMLKWRQDTPGNNAAVKKRTPHLGWRRNAYTNLQNSEGQNRYTKNNQWKRMRKFKKRSGLFDDEMEDRMHEVNTTFYRTQTFADMETQLFNLTESNYRLKEELLNNRTMLIEQTEERIKMENELQKITVRLNDIKNKVVLLNCLSSKANSENQLIVGLKYIFEKLELYSMMKQNIINEEIILKNMKPLWNPQQNSGNYTCLERRPCCPPLQI